MNTQPITPPQVKDKATINLFTKRFSIKDELDYTGLNVDFGGGTTNLLNRRWRCFEVYINTNKVYGEARFNDSIPNSGVVTDWQSNADMLATLIDFDFALPINPDGTIVNGDYKVKSKGLYQDENDESKYYFVENEVNFKISYTKPKVEITMAVDLALNPLMSVNDITNYQVDGVTATLTTSPTGTLQYLAPNIAGGGVIASGILSVQSNTVYVGTAGARIQNRLGTWDYTSKVFQPSTYASGKILIHLIDIFSGTAQLSVEDSSNLCGVFCCLQKIKERYDYAVSKGRGGSTDAQQLKELFDEANNLAQYAMLAVRCGRTKVVNDVLIDIKNLTGCKDCGCGEAGTLIPDLSGNNSSVNSVIAFTAAASASQTVQDVGLFVRVPSGTNTPSTYTDPRLLGKVFSDVKRDFTAYFDGQVELNGSFNTETGTFTFGQQIQEGVKLLFMF